MRRTGALAFMLAVAAWGWGCDDGAGGEGCGESRDCASGQVCLDGRCVAPRDGGGGQPGPSGAGGNRSGADDAGQAAEDVGRPDLGAADGAVRADGAVGADAARAPADGGRADGSVDAAVDAAGQPSVDGAIGSDATSNHGPDGATPPDAVAVDAAPVDAAAVDAGPVDAAAVRDAAPSLDGGPAADAAARLDAAPSEFDAALDAAAADGGGLDARVVDASLADAVAPDASPPDAACPPAAELCNAVDDDCDGLVDEDFAVGTACCADDVAPADPAACVAPGSWRCAEDGAAVCAACVPPTATLACNGVDDDCDGTVDEVEFTILDRFHGTVAEGHRLVDAPDAGYLVWLGPETDGGRTIKVTRTPRAPGAVPVAPQPQVGSTALLARSLDAAVGFEGGVDVLYRDPTDLAWAARWSAEGGRVDHAVPLQGLPADAVASLASTPSGTLVAWATIGGDGRWSIEARWVDAAGVLTPFALGDAPPTGLLPLELGAAAVGARGHVFWRDGLGPGSRLVVRTVDAAADAVGPLEVVVEPVNGEWMGRFAVRGGPAGVLVAWATESPGQARLAAGRWDEGSPAAGLEIAVEDEPLAALHVSLSAGKRITWLVDAGGCPIRWVDLPDLGVPLPPFVEARLSPPTCTLRGLLPYEGGALVDTDGGQYYRHVAEGQPGQPASAERAFWSTLRAGQPRVAGRGLGAVAFGDLLAPASLPEGDREWLVLARVSAEGRRAQRVMDWEALVGACAIDEDTPTRTVAWSAGGPSTAWVGCAVDDGAEGWRLKAVRFDADLQPVAVSHPSPALPGPQPVVIGRWVTPGGRLDLLLRVGAALHWVRYAEDWSVSPAFFDLGASSPFVAHYAPESDLVRVVFRSPSPTVCAYTTAGAPRGCVRLDVPEDFRADHAAIAPWGAFVVRERDPVIAALADPPWGGVVPAVPTAEGHAMGTRYRVAVVGEHFAATNHRDLSLFSREGERLLVFVGAGLPYTPPQPDNLLDLGSHAASLTPIPRDIATFFRCD